MASNKMMGSKERDKLSLNLIGSTACMLYTLLVGPYLHLVKKGTDCSWKSEKKEYGTNRWFQ
jgi:hypothetical protein